MKEEQKQKFRGRPKKETIRMKIISIRLSDTEFILIKEKADLVKRGVSSYMRISSLSNHIQFTITDEDRLHIRKLTGMANNINQMAKNSHIHGFNTLFQEFIELRNSITEIIKKIQK